MAKIASNVLWNLMGSSVPILAAIFAIPLLIKGLGVDRFGVLTLAWVVIGYFNLFDLGLGRALTKLVAERLGAGKEKEIPAVVWTSLAFMLVLGFIGMFILWSISPMIVYEILKISESLQSESLLSFYLLAVSIPIVIITTGFQGILVANQRFGLVNAVRIPLGVFTFVGPLIALSFSKNLSLLVAVLLVGRTIALAVYVALCFYVMPLLRKKMLFQQEVIGPLFRFGSWMTVSNIISPLMVYLDRFLIGALISATAVAYYATPHEVVTKLWIIPGALTGVLFPAFASTLAQDRNRASVLFTRGLKSVFLVIFPVTLIIVAMAHHGLDFWLGSEFTRNSTHVLQWLSVGVFINSFGQISYALVQGAGRPDITAKLHLLELPFYLLAVWLLVAAYGINGAAFAWVARVSIDTVLLFVVTKRFITINADTISRLVIALITALLFLSIAAISAGLIVKAVLFFLMLPVFVFASWFFVLDVEERMLVKDRLKELRA